MLNSPEGMQSEKTTLRRRLIFQKQIKKDKPINQKLREPLKRQERELGTNRSHRSPRR